MFSTRYTGTFDLQSSGPSDFPRLRPPPRACSQSQPSKKRTQSEPDLPPKRGTSARSWVVTPRCRGAGAMYRTKRQLTPLSLKLGVSPFTSSQVRPRKPPRGGTTSTRTATRPVRPVPLLVETGTVLDRTGTDARRRSRRRLPASPLTHLRMTPSPTTELADAIAELDAYDVSWRRRPLLHVLPQGLGRAAELDLARPTAFRAVRLSRVSATAFINER